MRKTKVVRKSLKIENVKIGQLVDYGFFSNVTFEGLNENGEVILKDRNGNIKHVYKNLFEKHASLKGDL